jgi:2-phospho-L-lactate guanylyltransferase
MMQAVMTKPAIIIPVKPPGEGKSRLAAALSPDARHALNGRLLRHTLDEVALLGGMFDVYVVSRSREVLAEAGLRRFVPCPEPDGCDLNGALSFGASQAGAGGAAGLMVLPIDLPWLSADRLRSVAEDWQSQCDVTIIADRVGDGTNVLIWRPIETAQFQFGRGSAARHAEAARRLGLRVAMLQDRHLSFDVDTADDLAIWSQRSEAGLICDAALQVAAG